MSESEDQYTSDYKSKFRWVAADPVQALAEKKYAKTMKKDLTEVHFHLGNKTEENFESLNQRDYLTPDVEILKKNKSKLVKGKAAGKMNKGGFTILPALEGQFESIYKNDFQKMKGLSSRDLAAQKEGIHKNMIAAHFEIKHEKSKEMLKESLYKRDFNQKEYCKRNPEQVKKMTQVLRKSNINFGLTQDHGEIFHGSEYRNGICFAETQDNEVKKTHLQKQVSIKFRDLIMDDMRKELKERKNQN